MEFSGFVDVHNHQFANLGFGGIEFFGVPDGPLDKALPWCSPAHGPGGVGDIIGTFMKRSYKYPHVGLGHKVGGWPQFDGWPRWDSVTHQMVHVDWLKRAWKGGLRVMVMLAVNNEWMANLPGMARAPGRTAADMEAADLQLEAALKLESRIDAEAGGAGLGWYRVVRSPGEAEAVASSGRLAVLLGIEVDYLFGSYMAAGLTPDLVKSSVKHYYDLGVRYVFPIHFADNAFGGTAFQNPMQGDGIGVQIPIPPFGVFETPYVLDCEDGKSLGYELRGGRRNKRGLTALGHVLIDELISYGILFDVDHMSYNTRAAVLDIAEGAGYPIISGHSGYIDVNLGEKRHEGQLTSGEVNRIRRLGGMLNPIIAQGALDGVSTWKRPDGSSVPHVCGGSANSFAQAYIYAVEKMQGGAVGLGTDFNGFAGVPGPTWGPDACPGGGAGGHLTEIGYPFTSVSGVRLDRSTAGDRTFDINQDGLVHVGMLPDFIAQLGAMGVTGKELEPLLKSANSFVRLWSQTVPAPTLGSIGVLSSNGSLSVKEGGLDAGWVLETGGPGGGNTASFQLDGNRIGVLSSNGSLSVKEGGLDAGWVLETGGPGGGNTASFQLDGNRIGVLSSNGSLSVKEGGLDAGWVLETGGPGGGNTASFQLDGNRIGVLSSNGSLSVKEGGLDAGWVLETGGPGGGNTASFQLDGNRIGVLSSNGSLSVKEGGLDAGWVLETGGPGGGDTASFQLDGNRIGVLSSNGSLSVKEGGLDAGWVLETGGPGGGDTASFQLDGNRIGVLSSNGSLSVKEGGLDAGWVLETGGPGGGDTASFQLDGNRIGVLSRNGSLSVKEGGLDAGWVLETGGPGGGDTASFHLRASH